MRQGDRVNVLASDTAFSVTRGVSTQSSCSKNMSVPHGLNTKELHHPDEWRYSRVAQPVPNVRRLKESFESRADYDACGILTQILSTSIEVCSKTGWKETR